MKAELIVCLAGLFLYLCVLVFGFVKVKKASKNTKLKVPERFFSIAVLSFLVEILPYIIPFSIFVEGVFCLCGVLALFIAFKDWLETIEIKK